MYTIGICDDEKTVCARIERWILARYKNEQVRVDVQVFISGQDLLKHLKSGKQLDLLFLDIELGSVNGVEIGRFIRNDLSNESMHIVYISAKQGYSMELFKNRPLNFFVKPLDKVDILESVENAMGIIISRHESFFEYKKGGKVGRIPYSNIMYFFSRDKKIVIKLNKECHEFYGKLSEITAQVPHEFIHIHQSYLINLDHIMKYEYEEIIMKDGVKLTISQGKRKKVREEIMKKIKDGNGGKQ